MFYKGFWEVSENAVLPMVLKIFIEIGSDCWFSKILGFLSRLGIILKVFVKDLGKSLTP